MCEREGEKESVCVCTDAESSLSLEPPVSEPD